MPRKRTWARDRDRVRLEPADQNPETSRRYGRASHGEMSGYDFNAEQAAPMRHPNADAGALRGSRPSPEWGRGARRRGRANRRFVRRLHYATMLPVRGAHSLPRRRSPFDRSPRRATGHKLQAGAASGANRPGVSGWPASSNPPKKRHLAAP